MSTPTLYIFAGLPGSGKSTIAQALARATGATYLRIDTIEQALRDLCDFQVEGEGYRLSYRVAADNLKNGNCVIADSCNPIELTRREWNGVAKKVGAHFLNIEIACSDKTEHRRRVQSRVSEVMGLKLPTWQQVTEREYHPWHCDRLTVDTAGKTVAACLEELMSHDLFRISGDR